MSFKSPKNYHEIIDKIHEILMGDSDVMLTTPVIYKYIDVSELVESLLKKNLDGAEFKLFEGNVICLSTGDINFLQDIKTDTYGNEIKSDYLIDVGTTNESLEIAKKDALILAENIRQVLKQNKYLRGTTYEARIADFKSMGFIKYPEYPYHYGYRIILKTVFR